MNARRNQSIAVNNRDINPSDQLAAAYPDLTCLLRNDPISQAFARFETMAVRWKRIYIFFGRLSLIAVLLATTPVAAQPVLGREERFDVDLRVRAHRIDE